MSNMFTFFFKKRSGFLDQLKYNVMLSSIQNTSDVRSVIARTIIDMAISDKKISIDKKSIYYALLIQDLSNNLGFITNNNSKAKYGWSQEHIDKMKEYLNNKDNKDDIKQLIKGFSRINDRYTLCRSIEIIANHENVKSISHLLIDTEKRALKFLKKNICTELKDQKTRWGRFKKNLIQKINAQNTPIGIVVCLDDAKKEFYRDVSKLKHKIESVLEKLLDYNDYQQLISGNSEVVNSV